VKFLPRPFFRPRSLVRISNNAVALRVEAPTGERMAMLLRPMTLRDAAERPFFTRRCA
jgi:hypothetical protein